MLLVLLAGARIAIGWFPIDGVAAGRGTYRGGIHLLLALVAFTLAPWAAITLTPSRHGEPLLGWLTAAFAVATIVSLRPLLRQWFGLAERGYYLMTLAWLALVSTRLL